MALGDPYATTTDLKNRLGMTTTTSAEDARLLGAVETASQEVELFCNRQFNSSGATPIERQFLVSSNSAAFTDDFHADPTSVKLVQAHGDGLTIETILVSTDYRLEPLEYIRAGFADPAPKWVIRNLSYLRWHTGWRTDYLKVTAKWGWATVPNAVKEATLLMAEEYYKLKDAPFGVVNWGEFGPVRVTNNRRAMGLLKQYSRGKTKVG